MRLVANGKSNQYAKGRSKQTLCDEGAITEICSVANTDEFAEVRLW